MTDATPPTRPGYKPLSRGWAKVEILLGLGAAGVGLLLGDRLVSPLESSWGWLAARFVLFVLGGYLALAGHRSHLYQSQNELAAYLVEEMRRSQTNEG